MAPPLTARQEKILHNLYYKRKFTFGRDRIFKLLRDTDQDISRRQVNDWLQKQEIHQIYLGANKSKVTKPTVLSEPGKQIGVDLIDMQNQEYDGYRYIFTAIDLFSKKAYAFALKDKTDKTVAEALKKLLVKVKPSSIRSDNGSEFISKEFQKVLERHGIKQVLSLPGKPQSNGEVERFNGTLKRMINKIIQIEGSFDWVKELDRAVENYNISHHDVTGQSPDLVERQGDNDGVKDKIKKRVLSKRDLGKVKFKKGDQARIKDANVKTKAIWSEKLYKIDKVYKGSDVSGPSYTLVGFTKRYYNNDLQKANVVENEIEKIARYEISKLVDQVVRDGKPSYRVRWKNFKAKDDTVEPRDELIKDVPKMVKAYEKAHGVAKFGGLV